MSLREWAIAALLSHWPLERVPVMPGHDETMAQRRDRYDAIVDAAVAAAEAEPPKPGGLSDKREAALLLAIAIGESGLARDADLGPCFIGPGHERRCDGRRSATVWQLMGSAWKIPVETLFADRGLAARLELKAARGSLWLCRKQGYAAVDGLSALSGKCQVGLKAAQDHYHRWNRIAAWMPPKPKETK
jgi:hypothetical protein